MVQKFKAYGISQTLEYEVFMHAKTSVITVSDRSTQKLFCQKKIGAALEAGAHALLLSA